MWVDFNVCGQVVIDLNMCGHVLIDLNECGSVVIDFNACGHVVSNFNGHTRTCTHNLGFPASFDEEEEKVEEEEGESELEGMVPNPERHKLARETALKMSLQSGLY